MEMDEELQRIFQIRPLQNKCIAFRSSSNEYAKMIKGACISDLKNLVNVEMKIEQVNVKVPDEKHIPGVTEEIKKCKVDCLLNEFGSVQEGLKLL